MFRLSNSKLNSLKLEYSSNLSRTDIEKYQLEKINALWLEASKKIPYYKNISKKLPKHFNTLSEFRKSVPILTKELINNDDFETCYPSPKSNFTRITGGSTAQPVHIPAWNSETQRLRYPIYLARSWYGLKPGNRLFLFWGHSHLLGNGLKGKINAKKRKIKDWLNNFVRFSSYDLSSKNLALAGEMVLKTKPDYIIGYSYSLDRLARSNSFNKDKLSLLDIKVVIGAAESFPFDDSIKVISDTFGAKVGMEYGSVETNLIAHTHPSGGYWVFWKDYFIESIDSEFGNEVFVTSLYGRKTPLFRYKIGDCINFDKTSIISSHGSVIKFSSVSGRSNKPIILMSGKKLHSEVVSHIVRDNKKITGYQFICKKDSIHLCLTTNYQFKNSIKSLSSGIKLKASKINSELSDNLQISIVEKLEQSIAGKTPMVIYNF